MDVSADVLDAKAYLLTKNAHGMSVYEHLTAVLSQLLSERPDNAVDTLEQISAALKSGAYKPHSDIPVRMERPGMPDFPGEGKS